MKNFKSNLKKAVLAIPLVLAMLLFGTTAVAGPGWSNTSMSARQSNADELSDRQPSSAWQPTYQGYQSQIFEIGTTNVPSDYSEISSESSSPHKAGPRKLGGGTDPGQQSENSPIGESWILLLFALLACGVIAYRRTNIKHHSIMKKIFTSSFHEKLKMLLIAIGLMVTSLTSLVWAADTYAIAGSMNSWSTTANQRSGTGAISITFSSTGNYTFKIIKNGTWCGNSGTMTRDNCSNWGFTYNGGDNCTISVDKTGTYTFNITNGTPTLSVTYPDPTWSVAGGFNNWSTTTNTFSSNTTSVNLEGGTTYEFKIYRKEGNVYYGNSGTMTSDNCTNWDFNTSDGNAKITTTVAGTYTFSLVNNTPRISVTYPTTYTLTYSIGSVAGNNGDISTSPTTTSGNAVVSGTNITLTGPAAKTGYTWKGWYTNAAGTEGKITDTNRAITVTMNADKTLYACYTENTFNVSASASTGGTVTPTSATSMGQITGGNITATADAGYSFTNWTISSGSGYFGTSGTATTSTTANTKFRPTDATTLLGTFSEVMRTVGVTVNNSYLGSVDVASLTNVGPATKSAAVTATPATGATFSNWTLPSGVTAADGYSASSNPIKVNATAASKTITANFSETMHSVTLTNDNSSYGTVNTSSPVSVGQITAVKIQATAKTNYMFSGWVQTAGSGTVTYYTGAGTGQLVDDTGASKATTYICVTGNVTLKATWEEDRSSGFVVHYGNDGKDAEGNTDPSQARAWQDGVLNKPTIAESNTSSFVFTASTSDVDKVIYFKIKKLSPETWYGNNGKIDGTISNWLFETSKNDARLCITMPGNYIFTWDKSTNKLSLTYPSVYYLRGGFNSWSWSHPMTETSSGVYSATVNMTEANHTYSGDNGFKLLIAGLYYGKNSTTITRESNTAASCNTSDGNIGITTDFTGNYTFNYTVSTNTLEVVYPAAFKLTYSIGSVAGTSGSISSSPTTTSGSYVLSGNNVTLTAPDAKTGYTWKGWYGAAGGTGDQLCPTKAYAITMNAAKTVYACYTENAYNVTVSAGAGGTVSPSGTVSVKQVSGTSITANPSTDFIFKDWTISGGGITPTTSSTSPQTFKATTTGGTITANFTNQWAICGIDDWETWNGLPKKTTNVYEGTVTLTAGNHTFKVVDRKNNTWYGKNSTTITRASSSVAGLSNSEGNITITADVPGTYTFNFNTNTKALTVTYPTAYSVTYDGNGKNDGAVPSTSGTYYLPGTNVTVTNNSGYLYKTDFAFNGWNTAATPSGSSTHYDVGGTINSIGADVTLYAEWVSNDYTMYYYNKDGWSSVYAYMWDVNNDPEKPWHGRAMTSYQENVYKIDYNHDVQKKVNFNNNASSQIDDLTIADGASGNKWFYNPNDATVNAGGIHHGWSQYFMIADYPTTKQVAVVGEKITIDPVFFWAEGVDFDDINITANRDSGSTNVTAMVAGTKIIATATAAGTAKYTITYSYLTTTITKVIRFQFAASITVQSKVPKTDPYWQYYQNVEGIHYWGTNLTPGDVKMTWLKADENYDYYQALVPLGTDNKTNFLFYFDSYKTDAWRKTLNVTNVTSDGCYTIKLKYGDTDIREAELSGTGLCSDSYQVVITMGSGDIYTSNIVTSSDEIVSFFAPSANESKTYRQGTVTLEHNGLTVYTYPANTFSASGVYTAKINANYSLNDLALYDGDYYIRTDGADGGWDHYKDAGMHNKMTQFTRNTNFPNESFSYYWVANVGHGLTQNIKGTVANYYNPVLCSFSPDETANERDGINLRFGYEPTTNDLVRGIIGGSTTDNFLNIVCADGSLIYKEMACTTLLDESHYESTPQDSKFQDKSNWVYEVIVYAKIDATHPVANVVLNSYYYGIHYLLGMVKDDQGRETSTPVSFPVIKTGTTEGVYGLRVVYDFKTNRLFAAWAPVDRVVDGILDVDADVMFLRHEDGDAAQISFKTDESKITDIKQAIFALELDNERASNIERHYFITLPFDCKVSSIFGIGGFMNYWGIQRYRGDLRAQKGWFKETSTFWEWLDADDVMQAGEGYLLSVDKAALAGDEVWKEGVIYQTLDTVKVGGVPVKTADGLSDSVVWVTHTDGSLLTMYFPSTTSGFTIEPATGQALTITYPDQPCTITRERRDKQDSNWKCIGTPGYKNVSVDDYSQWSDTLVVNPAPNFLYVFHEQKTGSPWAKGTYTIEDGSKYTYQSFHSYMVQFAGTVDWAQYSKGDAVPSSVAPRRMPGEEYKATKAEIDLLSADNESLDRTFVWLQEGATTGFDQNYDLNKMTQKNANQIYSFAEDDVPFAANVLPLETDTVQMVVNIANKGEFIFSLNNDKHVGMAPVLYDMFKSEKVNLMTTDYVVELETGKYDDRFFLLFQPEAPIVTNFETTADGGQNVHSSEAIYDVLGRRVNTIYPGHLYIVNGEKRIAK